jgi:hypothetical protein
LAELLNVRSVDENRGLLRWPLAVALRSSVLVVVRGFPLAFAAAALLSLGCPQLLVVRGEDGVLEIVDQRSELERRQGGE